MFHPQNSVAVASIHLPLAGTPISSSALQSVDNSTCKLQFIVFRNGKLFPCTGNSSNLADDGKRRSVSTPVAFTKLGKRKSIFIIMPVMSTLYCSADSDYMLTHTHTHAQCPSVCSAQHVDTQALTAERCQNNSETQSLWCCLFNSDEWNHCVNVRVTLYFTAAFLFQEKWLL